MLLFPTTVDFATTLRRLARNFGMALPSRDEIPLVTEVKAKLVSGVLDGLANLRLPPDRPQQWTDAAVDRGYCVLNFATLPMLAPDAEMLVTVMQATKSSGEWWHGHVEAVME